MEKTRLMLVQMRDDEFMRHHEQQVFARACGVPIKQFTIVDARTDEMPASLLDGHDAVFVGGSGEYSVAKGAPFVPRLGRFMRDMVERKIPTLGVCFGFHALALAFGGPVKTVEASSETGTFLIETTEAAKTDPLFAKLPGTFYGQQGHNDSVITMPEPLVSLARSQRCPHQACVIPGTPVYGIQFHPELRLSDLKARLAHYGYLNSPERHELIKDHLHETPETESMIQTFLRHFVGSPTQVSA